MLKTYSRFSPDCPRAPETWRIAVEQGYPRLRAAGAELAKEGVDFLDASGVFKDHPEPLYRDTCHFEQPGYAFGCLPPASPALRMASADQPQRA